MTRETSTEGLGESFGAVARRLRAASMASLSAWDVTPSQMRAIRILTGHEGGVRASELAHHLHIAPRSATEVVDALEAKGLVERSPDPTDRRATLVSLTARGTALTDEVDAPVGWSPSGSSSGSARPTAPTWRGSCAGSCRTTSRPRTHSGRDPWIPAASLARPQLTVILSVCRAVGLTAFSAFTVTW